MAYNERIADRIREALVNLPDIEEKHMFGGVCFMVNGKMCIGVIKENMMCRIDPAVAELVVEEPGCRAMDFQTRPMKGYVYVSEEAIKTKKEFERWVNLCLDFNKVAKASKPKKKK